VEKCGKLKATHHGIWPNADSMLTQPPFTV